LNELEVQIAHDIFSLKPFFSLAATNPPQTQQPNLTYETKFGDLPEKSQKELIGWKTDIQKNFDKSKEIDAYQFDAVRKTKSDAENTISVIHNSIIYLI
jgi:hypothetical protein